MGRLSMHLLSHLKTAKVWAPAVALATFACVSPPLESPATKTVQQTPIRVAQNIKNKVDILFLVDNSNSMQAMSDELKNRFGQFFMAFQNLADNGTKADMQIGVVTSDFGAGTLSGSGCSPSPGGQDGKLQAIGVAAPTSCQPPMGANFIKYDFANPTATNLPSSQNLVQTFTCMASVGANGCGFEHQLESVYSALHDAHPENAGFVRNDALLTVVFLTNEDDCSAPPDTDLFTPGMSQYGYLDSYRCTRFGIVDGNGNLLPYGDSGGPIANAASAPNPGGAGPGKLYDISRYIQYFTKPASQGGIKASPQDVILVGIDAPSDPVSVILSNPGTPGGQAYQQCPQLNEQTSPPCVPVLDHSCQNPQQPVFFGDPAVRLNTVINAAPVHGQSSICDSDYSGALQKAADLINTQIGGGCLPSCLPDVNNPDCVVEDVTANTDGTTTVTEIPQCDSSGTFPCWRVEMKPVCATSSPQGVGVTIDRNGMPAPPNTDARVACATLTACP